MRRLAWAGAVAFAALAGCGGGGPPETVPVEGVVTIDNKPAAGLLLQFHPDSAGGGKKVYGSSAVSGPDGKFVLQCETGTPGAVVGSHKVVVIDNDFADAGEPTPGKQGPRKANRVPKAYLSPLSSPVSVTVEPGKTGYKVEVVTPRVGVGGD